ncbi:MAG: TorF family putative porin [Pseudomonadota bacterium]
MARPQPAGPGARGRYLCAALLAACAFAPLRAHGQLALSASLLSEYRYRGAALSDGGPVAQLGLNYDGPNGVFVGVHASGARLRRTDANAQAILYAGLARRLGAAASWEAGVSAVRFRGAANYDYHELFAGLSAERMHARLYYSPHYFGVGGSTVYAEAGASAALGAGVELFGQCGYLRPVGEAPRYWYVQNARADLRVGLSARIDAWSAQLAWVAAREKTVPYAPPGPPSHALVLGLTRAF